MGYPATLADFEAVARRRLPRKIYNFIRMGSGSDLTLRRNAAAFDRYALRSRVLRDVSDVDLSAEIFGHRYAAPIFLAPTGLQGIVWPEGELAMARAAATRGAGLLVSANAAHPLEEVARAHGAGQRWMQISLWRDEALVDSFVDRAERAGYTGLMVLLADRLSASRHNDLVTPTLADVVDGVRRPRWAAQFARRRVNMANFAPYLEDKSLRATLEYSQQMINPASSWADLERLRARWTGRLLVKGVEDQDDARRALDSGVDGFVISNSGGRGMDPSTPSLDVLRRLRAVIPAEHPVLVDGSVRNGAHLITALCLGADAVIIGRPALWGLAAKGQAGVEEIIDLLAEQTREQLMGMDVASVAALEEDMVDLVGPPGAWPAPPAGQQV